MTSIGSAELLLISDFPIGEEHFTLIRQLAGEPIRREEIAVAESGRTCTWPLRVSPPSYSSIRSVGSHIWSIANYLTRHRETVKAI